MRILIIDDKPENRKAAKAQLSEHKLVTVGSYDGGQELVKKKHKFDAVLVDLLMPASDQQMNFDDPLVGQEMPVGIFLALLAAKNGAKYVVVFSDQSHHEHPAAACFDAFNRHEVEPTPFMVGDAKILLTNNRNWVKPFCPNDLSREMEHPEYSRDRDETGGKNTVMAKDWRDPLDYLIAYQAK